MLQSAESTPTRTTPADHISQILFDTDDSLLKLHLNGRESLVDGDSDGYKDFIEKQTEVIAGLSALVLEYRNTGGEVSSEIEVFALHHSQLASDALNEGSEYPRFVFFPIGTDRGGPSTLHQLGDKSLLD
jgi:hypothetical protein